MTTSVAALAVFVWYAAIKGAYLSNDVLDARRGTQRHDPCRIPSAATALAFARGVGRGWAIALAAGGLTLYVIVVVPLRLDIFPDDEAHGLSIGTS